MISEIISFNINPIDDPDNDEPIDEDDDKTELTIPVSYHLFVSVGALVGLTFIAIKKKTRKQ